MSVRLTVDRPWSEYPIGTKAHSCTGGCWTKTERGWKWGRLDGSGGTFPTPGGDAVGECVELPMTDQPTSERPTPESQWVIIYEDQDHPFEYFTDEEAARKTLEIRLGSWSCHLFVSEELARKLERERDEARDDIAKLLQQESLVADALPPEFEGSEDTLGGMVATVVASRDAEHEAHEHTKLQLAAVEAQVAELKAALDYQNMPNRTSEVRGGYEFYINEEWTGLRSAAIDTDQGWHARLSKRRYDPDEERVRVRRIKDDDSILSESAEAADLRAKLAAAEEDTQLLDWLIKQGPPGAEEHGMGLTQEVWDVATGMCDGGDDQHNADQVLIRSAIRAARQTGEQA